MNNIEFLDAAIKAFDEPVKIKVLSDGSVGMNLNNCFYYGKTIDECVGLIREAFSELHLQNIKKNCKEAKERVLR